jgi:hypothetical protein
MPCRNHYSGEVLRARHKHGRAQWKKDAATDAKSLCDQFNLARRWRWRAERSGIHMQADVVLK